MELIIYTDLHLGAPYEIKADLTFGKNIFYIGDIVDLTNCKKELIESFIKLISTILSKAKCNYIRGNHEMNADRRMPQHFDGKVLQYFQIYEGIYLAHGDFGLLWSTQRSNKFTSQKLGSKWLMRTITRAIEQFRKIFPYKISNDSLERIYTEMKKREVNTIILGHGHPKKRLDIQYKGKRIIILPRGKNIVRL